MATTQDHGGSSERCLRCGLLPDSSSPECLLLAPLDMDAEEALVNVLKRSGRLYERRGIAFAVAILDSDPSQAAAELVRHMPPALRARVKGVRPDPHDGPESMLRALVRAETLGVWLEQMEDEWAHDVLADDTLFSLFHPIVRADTGRVYAHEALIRARHPHTGEIIGAAQLLFACGRLNLLHQLDQRARQCAIRTAAALGNKESRYFINFLPHAIYDPDVCLRSTRTAAEEAGLDMQRLVFEVVEAENVADIEHLCKILSFYRQQGAGIALDNVSSGLFSMQALTALQPDFVKIDRDLVASAAVYTSARNTLDSIVGLSKKLGAEVVAEGIETPEQMQLCVEAGVDYLQGFLIARPANPPTSVTPVLRLAHHAA